MLQNLYHSRYIILRRSSHLPYIGLHWWNNTPTCLCPHNTPAKTNVSKTWNVLALNQWSAAKKKRKKRRGGENRCYTFREKKRCATDWMHPSLERSLHSSKQQDSKAYQVRDLGVREIYSPAVWAGWGRHRVIHTALIHFHKHWQIIVITILGWMFYHLSINHRGSSSSGFDRCCQRIQ